MKFRRVTAAISVLPLAFGLLAATSEPTDCRPFDDTLPEEEQEEICTLETFLQCPADDTEKAHHEALNGDIPLDLTIPDRSVEDGAGCGRVPQPVVRGTTTNTEFDMQIAGILFENIDEMTVVLHAISVGPERAGETVVLPVRVQVDGQMVLGADDTAAELLIEGTPSDTGASYEFRFTITDIDAIANSVNDEPLGMIRIAVSYPQGPTPAFGLGGAYTWVWGTTEVPAGVILNPGADADRGLEVVAGS